MPEPDLHLGDVRFVFQLTFRTLVRASEAILEEPPAERGAGAIYRLLRALQPIAATLFSP
jgi:hypothetical protein